MEEENASEEKQEELKKESGIDDEEGELHVREKGPFDYIKGFFNGIFYVAFVALIFVGLVTLINPISRGILLELIMGFTEGI